MIKEESVEPHSIDATRGDLLHDDPWRVHGIENLGNGAIREPRVNKCPRGGIAHQAAESGRSNIRESGQA